MSQIEVVAWDAPMPAETCWAEWTPDVPCPNRAAWVVQNLDNDGYTRLCGLHRDAFAALEPLDGAPGQAEASVAYVALEEEAPSPALEPGPPPGRARACTGTASRGKLWDSIQGPA